MPPTSSMEKCPASEEAPPGGDGLSCLKRHVRALGIGRALKRN
jgi:hypothetical protein